ncbi:DNA-3-methyladenine glycosylase 2 family protein [Paenibacillus sp. GD4]|uniref:DNA-3-methyladenine glycosylase family protein n=1 Tax=Paenibacillus sp. GD4 TaxID=3068890 RepID=UPI002796D26B|nr:DNA-3-methyladenine glycosylase 2 family protein [Paenibacillus sp. GD4]MDQ1914137.1 DNA-3-methyladenine glycosylase 2 family protein [Paenibacillus sp. GD4]
MSVVFQLHPGEPRVQELCQTDRRFAELAQRIGIINISAKGDAFAYLAQSLISQQLSVKAADTICRRVREQCGDFTVDRMLSVSEEVLRAAGVSGPKIRYIKGLAELIRLQELDLDSLHGCSNEEVLALLTKVKGVGRWTAEMFLIFYLGREDVLSLGDAGLRRAARWLYEEETLSGPELLELKGEKWKPYRSIASLYLWEAINVGLVDAGPLPTTDLC